MCVLVTLYTCMRSSYSQLRRGVGRGQWLVLSRKQNKHTHLLRPTMARTWRHSFAKCDPIRDLLKCMLQTQLLSTYAYIYLQCLRNIIIAVFIILHIAHLFIHDILLYMTIYVYTQCVLSQQNVIANVLTPYQSYYIVYFLYRPIVYFIAKFYAYIHT